MNSKNTNTFSAVVMAIALTCALVELVSGISMLLNAQSSLFMAVVVLTISGSLVIWFSRQIFIGIRTRELKLFNKLWIGLAIIAAFGLQTGFALFDVLSGNLSLSRLTLFVSSIIGLVTMLITIMAFSEEELNELANASYSQQWTTEQPAEKSIWHRFGRHKANQADERLTKLNETTEKADSGSELAEESPSEQTTSWKDNFLSKIGLSRRSASDAEEVEPERGEPEYPEPEFSEPEYSAPEYSAPEYSEPERSEQDQPQSESESQSTKSDQPESESDKSEQPESDSATTGEKKSFFARFGKARKAKTAETEAEQKDADQTEGELTDREQAEAEDEAPAPAKRAAKRGLDSEEEAELAAELSDEELLQPKKPRRGI